MNVVVLGASKKRNRYSNMAVRSLSKEGHRVIPVHPSHDVIEGLPVLSRLEDVEASIDTATLYLSPAHARPLLEAMVALKARRWIFNPGTEDAELEGRLRASGALVLRACTLVLLSTGRF